MKFLLIDASRANVKEKTGVEWYAFHIICELMKRVPKDVEVEMYTREKLRDDWPALPPHWHHRVLAWPPRFLWSIGRLSFELLKYNKKQSVLFVPASIVPLSNIPVITMIHDVGFLRVNNWYSFFERIIQKLSLYLAVKQCTALIVPSQFTRSELLTFFPALKDRIHVIEHYQNQRSEVGNQRSEIGNQKSEVGDQKLEIRFLTSDLRFLTSDLRFLFVGRIENKKNIFMLIEGFERFMRKSVKPASLHIVGSTGFGYARIMSRIEKSNFREYIVMHGYVTPQELDTLYSHATALVFVSLYEGFGLPVLEARMCGKYVICSDIPALREVAGERARFVNPCNPTEIAHAMLQAASPTHEDKMNDEMFSWETSAEKLWNVLSTVGNKKKAL